MRNWIIALLMPLTAVNDNRTRQKERAFVQEDFSFARWQLNGLLREADARPSRFPRTIDSGGRVTSTDSHDWTSGFFPGCLWYVYEYTSDTALKEAAIRWTEKLSPIQYDTDTHDLGFMMYCSYGNAYRLTGNPAYKKILVQAARSLCTRFNPITGTIRSWNSFTSWHGSKTYDFPVIIDNMMNLELLFFAYRVTGDTMFRHVALSHAEMTLRYQIRPDHSCYHVVCYDQETGKVLARETAQGYADNSTWSRGQAWGIYGFTVAYRETRDTRFLSEAMKMADYFIDNKNLPSDQVPFWDFNANADGFLPGVRSNAFRRQYDTRDVSAAAVVASALFELGAYCGGAQDSVYIREAVQILHTLSGPAYRAAPGRNGNFLLMHSVGSIPHGVDIDVPLIYADYYFMEALLRYDRRLKASNR